MATRDHSPLGIHVPARLVAPIDNALLTNPNLLQEEIVVIDFGQSFCMSRLPTDYKPATVPHYLSPEARFEGKIGAPSDIWALGCTIFEIRAGFPIFETFFGGDDEVLMQTVATLGSCRCHGGTPSETDTYGSTSKEYPRPRSFRRFSCIRRRRLSFKSWRVSALTTYRR